jgi:hypothetical protein
LQIVPFAKPAECEIASTLARARLTRPELARSREPRPRGLHERCPLAQARRQVTVFRGATPELFSYACSAD